MALAYKAEALYFTRQMYNTQTAMTMHSVLRLVCCIVILRFVDYLNYLNGTQLHRYPWCSIFSLFLFCSYKGHEVTNLKYEGHVPARVRALTAPGPTHAKTVRSRRVRLFGLKPSAKWQNTWRQKNYSRTRCFPFTVCKLLRI